MSMCVCVWYHRSMQELQVRFEPPDLLGIPPDPLPVPLFSAAMLSSGIYNVHVHVYTVHVQCTS